MSPSDCGHPASRSLRRTRSSERPGPSCGVATDISQPSPSSTRSSRLIGSPWFMSTKEPSGRRGPGFDVTTSGSTRSWMPRASSSCADSASAKRWRSTATSAPRAWSRFGPEIARGVLATDLTGLRRARQIPTAARLSRELVLATEFGTWLHVDGAYGLFGRLDERTAPRLQPRPVGAVARCGGVGRRARDRGGRDAAACAATQRLRTAVGRTRGGR